MRLFSILAAPLLALGLAGCGGGGGTGGGGGGPPPGPTVLLDERFENGLTSVWMDSSVRGGSLQIAQGNPEPGLQLSGPYSPTIGGGQGGIRGQVTWSTQALTIAFDARKLAPTNSEMEVQIRSFAGAILAQIYIGTSYVTYYFRSGPNHSQVMHQVTPDSAWHRFTLTIDPSGYSEWRRDGLLRHTLQVFPLIDVYLEVVGPAGTMSGGDGVGQIDSILVTAP